MWNEVIRVALHWGQGDWQHKRMPWLTLPWSPILPTCHQLACTLFYMFFFPCFHHLHCEKQLLPMCLSYSSVAVVKGSSRIIIKEKRSILTQSSRVQAIVMLRRSRQQNPEACDHIEPTIGKRQLMDALTTQQHTCIYMVRVPMVSFMVSSLLTST